MTAILKVDTIQDTSGNNIINESSDTITIGAAGDTVNVPGTEVKTNKVSPTSGTSLQIGDSGDTVNIVGTLQNNGSALVTGKVLQVVQGTDTSSQSSSSTSYTSGTINASITPSATSSKILVHITGTMRNGTFNIYRGSTDLGGGQGFGQTNGDEAISAIHYLDSPNTTSSVTYTGYMKASNGGTVYFGVGGYTVITLMEIGA